MTNITFTGAGPAPNQPTVSNSSVTYYGAYGSTVNQYNTSEAWMSPVYRTAGTLRNMYVYVPSNSRTTNTLVNNRINFTNGNVAVTIQSNQTGSFTDTQDYDTISNGTNMNFAVTMGNSAESILVGSIGAEMDGTTQDTMMMSAIANYAVYANNSPAYFSPMGNTTPTSNEVQRQSYSIESGTLSNMQYYVSANSRTANASVWSRINGNNGLQALTITSGQTGLYEDLSDSDPLSVGTLFDSVLLIGNGNGTVTVSLTDFKYTSPNANETVAMSGGGQVVLVGGVYWGLFDFTRVNSEVNAKFPMPISGQASGLTVYVDSNTANANCVATIRKNGANGTQIVTVLANQTGAYTDTADTDTFRIGDYVNLYTPVGNSATYATGYGFKFSYSPQTTILGTPTFLLMGV